MPLGDHASSAVVIFFIIRNEDLILGNEPELCGFGCFYHRSNTIQSPELVSRVLKPLCK